MERNGERANSFSPSSSLGSSLTSDAGISNVSVSRGAPVSEFNRHSKAVLQEASTLDCVDEVQWFMPIRDGLGLWQKHSQTELELSPSKPSAPHSRPGLQERKVLVSPLLITSEHIFMHSAWFTLVIKHDQLSLRTISSRPPSQFRLVHSRHYLSLECDGTNASLPHLVFAVFQGIQLAASVAFTHRSLGIIWNRRIKF